MPYIVALRPPGNIAKEVADLQRHIRTVHGLVSTAALPPMLILAGTNDPPARSFLEDASIGAFTALRPDRVRRNKKDLELALTPHSDLLAAIASHFGNKNYSPGFFLGDARERRGTGPSTPGARGLTDEEAVSLPLPSFTLRSGRLSVFELDYSDSERWWESIVWIERWRSRTLRLRR